MTEASKPNKPIIDRMFKSGAHFGFVKSRRHPTTAPYIFGAKNKIEIFDLEKTSELLETALTFVATLAKEGKTILLVSGKNEAKSIIKNAAESLGMPYVAGRWVGGTLTNWPEIKKRIEKLLNVSEQKKKGELAKYTKKERLIIDKELSDLDTLFSGLVPMKDVAPKALFVIDAKHEYTAVNEAKKIGIPVIALCGSDCNLEEVDYPIVGNDSSRESIALFIEELVKAYSANKMAKDK